MTKHLMIGHQVDRHLTPGAIDRYLINATILEINFAGIGKQPFFTDP